MIADYRSRKIDWRIVDQRLASWKGHAYWPGAHRWLQQAKTNAGFPSFLVKRRFLN